MLRPSCCAVVALVTLVLLPAPCGAQALPPDPAEGGRMQIGPFSFFPSLELSNAGTDSNVFNDSANPRSDQTATVSPALRMVVRGGPARVTYGGRVDYVWFKKYESERSTNARTDGKLEFRFTRIVPFVSGGLTDTRERPSAEIDLRASRRETRLGTGAAFVLGPAAVLSFGVRQQEMNFAADQFFGGVSLEGQLDETLRAGDAEFRLDLSPLTTFSVKGTMERQRFAFSRDRDSDSWIITPALEFNPSALIAGTLAVGYRHFDAASPLLSDFDGLVAQADLTYVLGAATRVQGRLSRDVQYSFEPQYPYYTGTGGQLTITQQIAGPFDVQATGGRQQLRYMPGGPSRLHPALRVHNYGGGIGIRVGEGSRLGLNVDVNKRRGGDEVPGRDYDRRRVYASLTYGF
jgi:hypothetical protein